MTQFNLDKWLEDKSRKVVTRDGRPVRIVCWDAKMECPIMALVLNKSINKEIALHYHVGGTYSAVMESDVDLFFADEEQLTEFEQELRYWIGQSLCNYENNGCISDNMSDSVNIYLEAASKKLLDLARMQLKQEMTEIQLEDTKAYQEGVKEGRRLERQDIDKELDEAYKSRDEIVYLEGYDQGKEDTLKDLPKWKKATEDKGFDRHVLLLEDARVVIASCVYKDEYYIELDDLKTLPKEE